MDSERKTGPVVHIVKERGYWFVLYNGRRIFCHISNWSELDFPVIGEIVSFELGESRRNSKFPFQAVNVRPEPSATGASTLKAGVEVGAE